MIYLTVFIQMTPMFILLKSRTQLLTSNLKDSTVNTARIISSENNFLVSKNLQHLFSFIPDFLSE